MAGERHLLEFILHLIINKKNLKKINGEYLFINLVSWKIQSGKSFKDNLMDLME